MEMASCTKTNLRNRHPCRPARPVSMHRPPAAVVVGLPPFTRMNASANARQIVKQYCLSQHRVSLLTHRVRTDTSTLTAQDILWIDGIAVRGSILLEQHFPARLTGDKCRTDIPRTADAKVPRCKGLIDNRVRARGQPVIDFTKARAALIRVRHVAPRSTAPVPAEMKDRIREDGESRRWTIFAN
ncbi:hypothetical protein EVAR_40835_1 [Eumeta japonica]|uniref:Uncharacterized protein n=1 Tax=Eumeta variegata TaxID=151549 RepID=A0A4C1WGT3_EUMVA|nr:hypothetical protein EVAR_40835_1 [Eumeta japonica]